MAGGSVGSQPPPHEVLGVAADADVETIRAQFLREARKWHPDKRPADEPAEAREAARCRFIEVHAAYEALQRGGASSSSKGAVRSRKQQDLPEYFKVTPEQLAEVRARKAATEAWLRELWDEIAPGVEGSSMSADEQKAVRRTWNRAFAALEAIKYEETELEMKLRYASALKGGASAKDRRTSEPADAEVRAGNEVARDEQEKQPTLDGPRTMSDHLEGVGSALHEMVFDFWAVCCPSWCRTGYGMIDLREEK
eukprot:TRINITY_DN37358_c0_g1_i1.p1 TRINITY_DN37358_c0_g1~~TRINITY_DN37358_c0_g1_i1.p1  ORF type:complete len:290 (-),score=80.52 TRINITY_DN37358_c0_g1_i1:110-868(-)